MFGRALATVLALLTAVALLPAGAGAAQLWSGDVETGDFYQWDELQAANSPIYDRSQVGDTTGDVVEQPTRGSRYAMRFATEPGTAPNGTARAEVYTSEAYGDIDDEAWYAWSTLIPSFPNQLNGWPSYSDWNVITQWNNWSGCGGPNVSVGVDPTAPVSAQLYFQQVDVDPRTCAVLARHKTHLGLVYDHWYDFVVHARWSTDESVGFVEVWIDGRLVVARQVGMTAGTSSGVYWKQGFYRGDFDATNVVVHDNSGVYDSFAAAAASFPTGSPFNPGLAAQPSQFTTWLTGAAVAAGCAGCSVTEADGEVRAAIAGAAEDRDTAFAERDFGGRAGIAGTAYYRDVVRLPARTTPLGDLGLFTVADRFGDDVVTDALDASRQH